MSERRVYVAGTGSYVPERVVPNELFDQRFGAGVGDWLTTHLEIHSRRWMADEQATSDLAVHAAREALQRAGLTPNDLDLLIVATDTPDQPSPSTASVVQHKLGATRAGTFDLNSACAGFVTAVEMASCALLARPQRKHALVVGAYGMSRHLNPHDKKTVTLFADGAGAAVLSATEADAGPRPPSLLGCDLHTEGQYHDWMGVYGGGTARPSTPERLAAGEHQLVFARKFPTEINPTTWTAMLRSLCARLDLRPDQIDHYVFTQLNLRSIEQTLDALEVPRSRGVTIMQQLGYTGSACIPMALHAAVADGRIQPGQLVALVASGGGLTFGAMLLRW